jgi:uncharacterized protein
MRNIVYLAGIVIAIAIASHFAFDSSREGKISVFVIMALPTVALAAVGIGKAHYDGVLRDWLTPKGGDFTRGFGGAALVFGGAYAFTKVIAPLPGSPHARWFIRFYVQLGEPADLRKNVTLVVLAIVIVSIAEEILWRGLVTTLLEERFGSRYAWIFAAVLYALAHVPTMWALRDPTVGMNPLIVLAALGAGLVWGFFAKRWGRLFPGIFSHILFDWTVVMMFRLWGPSP